MKTWMEKSFYQRRAPQKTKRAKQIDKEQKRHERWLREDAKALKKFQDEIERAFPFTGWIYPAAASGRMAETVINGETAWIEDGDTFVLHFAFGIEWITGIEYFRRSLKCGHFPEFLERMQTYKNSMLEQIELETMIVATQTEAKKGSRL